MNSLCSDKTGTLMKDNIVLTSVVGSANLALHTTLHDAFLNAFFQEGLENPIDLAIIQYVEMCIGTKAIENIKSQYQKVSELLFDFDRRLLSVIVHDVRDVKATLITKGAAEEVLLRGL